ncbi:MAG TPA: sulfatase [Gemmatimonadaceae bacterium]|nr:sulfatase [Gemmatimonadaceae bacterium]
MKRVAWLAASVVVAFALATLSRSADAQTRLPNIVVIVADDMGYADIGVHGSKDISTPNIDALAATGIRFTDGYVSGPFCSPTRAGLMTGRYPQRFGHEMNIVGPGSNEWGLPVEERTIADRLKAAGYRTAVIGKWHLGSAPRFHPLERGFDEFFGFLGAAHSYMPSHAGDTTTDMVDGRSVVPAAAYLTEALADRSADFIKRHRSRPFFLYLAFNAPHLPLEATERYVARFPRIADQRRRTYAAMLSAMDDGIGKTMAALRTEGLDENTLIFFFSDNGGPIRMAGDNASSNAPLRGSKRQMWEGGVRVPFIIRWKGHIPEGRTDSRPIIQHDVFATSLAAAGIPVNSEWKLDGVNLLPFLTGAASGSPHDVLYWRLGGMMAVRQGDWKLVKMHDGLPRKDSVGMKDLLAAELYNLKTDIGETKNLAAANPDKVRELAAVWLRWSDQLAKPRWYPSPNAAPPEYR